MYSRMKKIVDEVKRLRDTYQYTVDAAIAVMEPAMKQRKGSLLFADKIGKTPEAELYGDVPDVEAEEERQREEDAATMATFAAERDDFDYPTAVSQSQSGGDERSSRDDGDDMSSLWDSSSVPMPLQRIPNTAAV